MEPKTLKDEFGECKNGRNLYLTAKPFTCSSKEKLQRTIYARIRKMGIDYNPTDCGLLYVDHCVGNVGWDRMIPVVKWYEEVMGFVNILSFDDKQINTEYSALMSK
jgi:4-hydroxyphenylpyruvate dioxygenase